MFVKDTIVLVTNPQLRNVDHGSYGSHQLGIEKLRNAHQIFLLDILYDADASFDKDVLGKPTNVFTD